MKKLVLVLIVLFIVTGCNTNLNNTPIKKVEEFLNKYQTLDNNVLSDLDTVLVNDMSITEKERDSYRDFFKAHYQDLDYEIKNETIDGDNAVVEVEVTVRSYADTIIETNNYKMENTNEFNDETGEYDLSNFSKYRLDELKKVKDTETYTLYLSLSKQDDKWKLNPLSDEELNKINGLYTD